MKTSCTKWNVEQIVFRKQLAVLWQNVLPTCYSRYVSAGVRTFHKFLMISRLHTPIAPNILWYYVHVKIKSQWLQCLSYPVLHLHIYCFSFTGSLLYGHSLMWRWTAQDFRVASRLMRVCIIFLLDSKWSADISPDFSLTEIPFWVGGTL